MTVDQAFLGRVTHDLRGELATMVAGVHYLLRYEAGVGETGKQMLDRVNNAGRRLSRLLDELELSAWIDRPTEGVALSAEACRIGPLVQAALGRLEKSVAQRRVAVDLDLPADLPEIEADPELLGAAIEHALDFAVARSPDRTVRVVAAEGEVRISDAGGAVGADALDHVFDPFVEKDLVPRPEPGARRRERLGLGLSIARGILAAHGGSIAAVSSGDGVTITLRLGSGCHRLAAV